MIGYATIDTEKLNTWIESERERSKNKVQINDPAGIWNARLWSSYFYSHQSDFMDCKHLFDRGSWGDVKDNIEEFLSLLNSLKSEDQRLQVFYTDETAVVLGFSKHKWILPAEIAEIEYLKNYDSLTAGKIAALGDKEMSEGMLPADITDQSKDSLQEELEDKKAKIKAAEQEYKAKIEEIRAEAMKKERELEELLEKETGKLKAMKDELEKKIFVLDTQIYGIRCYLGEVIDFTLIRDGKTADINEPIVVYQKFRYLDEELGKYFSLYDLEDITGTQKTFMEILKHRDDMRDIFCPSERTVSVLRISRSGTIKGASEKVNNCLVDYEYLHAKQIAILVRDGEKLYIGWTDDERVKLSSEDMFLRPGVSVDKVPEKKHDYWSESREEEYRIRSEEYKRSERISRYFLFSILQGMIDNGNMIKLPEKVKISEESKYIKFSYAEGWLKDNRFGTMSDILDKSKNIPIKKGDTILTGLYISRDDRRSGEEYAAYSNTRGIGDKNRTHGASIPGFDIMDINKILKRAHVKVTFDIYPAEYYATSRVFVHDGKIVYRLRQSRDENSNKILGSFTRTVWLSEDDFNECHKADPSPYDAAVAKYQKYNVVDDVADTINSTDEDNRYFSISADRGFRFEDLPEMANVGIIKVTSVELIDDNVDIKAYVSVPTESSRWNGTNSRCNFEIYDDEYIRLNYLCSTWLRYVIVTGNLGDFTLGGSRINYADSLKYLNKLLAEVSKREEKEKELLKEAGLENWVDNTPEWDRVLCEWRIKNSMQVMNTRTVKKFTKEVAKLADQHENPI